MSLSDQPIVHFSDSAPINLLRFINETSPVIRTEKVTYSLTSSPWWDSQCGTCPFR